MSKLKVLSGKEVCKILSSHGFIQVRQKGSHIVMQKKIKNRTLTVPVPNHSEIKIGTLNQLSDNQKFQNSIFKNNLVAVMPDEITAPLPLLHTFDL